MSKGTDVDVGLLDFCNHLSTTSLDHSSDYGPKLGADAEILTKFYVLSCKRLDGAWRFKMG
jgi:hypothetical protein